VLLVLRMQGADVHDCDRWVCRQLLVAPIRLADALRAGKLTKINKKQKRKEKGKKERKKKEEGKRREEVEIRKKKKAAMC
jgi:hypothetical protein